MRPPALLYGLYERRLNRALEGAQLPKHVGVMLDGNRRWARAVGLDAAHGHRAGAQRIHDLLTWCEEAGVEVVTMWMLSTDNLRREPQEVEDLLQIIAMAVDDLGKARRWRLRMVGELGLLPDEVADRLMATEEATADVEGMQVNVAVGYGGRHEIANAVRSLLKEHVAAGRTVDQIADSLTEDDIAEHLYTKGQPDPDLVIRTSGEQRLGGFLLWQSAHSEFYFCEAFWPDFRRIDFLRALRSYATRERRMGR
ncbi:MAG TPA: isoprenyl transferase [Beutenbergiaceae bacterium]|nr:isoprenyl transferase [Beutenbergiaceae bacterium]